MGSGLIFSARRGLLLIGVCAAALGQGWAAQAQQANEPVTRDELRSLEDALAAQQKRLVEQERELAAQRETLLQQRRQIEYLAAGTFQAAPPNYVPAVHRPVLPRDANGNPMSGRLPVQAQQAQAPASGAQKPVGEAPPAQAPEVPAIAERSGVLTRAGHLTIEPSVDYTHSSINRFVVSGLEISDVLLVGTIEATAAERDSVTARIGGRLGITNRLEIEARVPYVTREDTLTTQLIQSPTPPSQTTVVDGQGLGDVEFGARYQLNSGTGGWPFLVGNMRVKTPTGTGPFDIPRDAQGRPLELPTGSGFWGVEPSITAIYPSDPAVFFANLGYLWNIERSIDQVIGGVTIGNVDPGDAVRMSFGVGIGINERASVSLGYKHDYIGESRTIVNGVARDSRSLQVGSLLFGISHRLSDDVSLNVGVEVGVTEDSPDVTVGIRLPISLGRLF
jgi:hypothetical protein